MLYYDVPVIDYYGALWRYIDAGVADWYEEIDGTVSADSLTRDKHHPSATGHKIIASAICYYLQDVLNSLKKTEATVPAIPEEPFFKNAELYETATFLASTDYNGYSIIEPAENTDFISASVHNSKMGTGWKCQNENGNGGKLTFTLKAVTSVSIFLEQSTAGGRATVTINGETVLNNASTKSGSKQMWPYYNKVFDTPRDITVTITCNEGAVAVAPIGVTY